MTARQDIHRPSVFDPADYEVVAEFDANGEFGGFIWFDRTWADASEALGQFAGNCQHCGHRNIRWVSVVAHKPTGTVLYFGANCSDKAGLENKDQLTRREIRSKLEREANKARIAFAQAWCRVDYPAECALLDSVDLATERFGFLADLTDKFRTYGYLTVKQFAAVRKIISGNAEREARRQKQEAQKGQLPTGGAVTVEGEVVTLRWDETQWGTVQKMLVLLDDGNKIWGNVPRDLQRHEGYDASADMWYVVRQGVEKGDRVRFTASVEASRNDSHFGIAKRARKAEIISRKAVAC